MHLLWERLSISHLYKNLSVIARGAIMGFLMCLIGNSSQASTIIVPSGGDLQAAINIAHCWDTLVIPSRVYFAPGDFTALNPANKGSGSVFIKLPSSVAQLFAGTGVFSHAVQKVKDLAALTVELFLHLALVAVVRAFVIADTRLAELFTRKYPDLKSKSHGCQVQYRNAGSDPKRTKRVKRKLKPKKVRRKRSSH